MNRLKDIHGHVSWRVLFTVAEYQSMVKYSDEDCIFLSQISKGWEAEDQKPYLGSSFCAMVIE